MEKTSSNLRKVVREVNFARPALYPLSYGGEYKFNNDGKGIIMLGAEISKAYRT